MRCIYCNRRLGFFKSSGSFFCSKDHEELYRTAIGAWVAYEKFQTNDLTKLFQATHAGRGPAAEPCLEGVLPAKEAETELMAAPVIKASARLLANTGNAGSQWEQARPSAGSFGGPARNPREEFTKVDWRRPHSAANQPARGLRATLSHPQWRRLTVVACGLAIAFLFTVVQPRTARQPAETARPIATGMHRAEIRGLESAWVTASADGKPLFSKIISKGESRQVEFFQYAFLHLGSTKGLQVTINGQVIQMGQRPGMRLVELRPWGVNFLPWTNSDPPKP